MYQGDRDGGCEIKRGVCDFIARYVNNGRTETSLSLS